jgi:hyperosmotically inducible protein
MKMRVFVSALIALTILVGVPFAAGAGGRSVGDKVDDAMITTKVKAKLSTEHAKNLVKVDVDTKDGVVHLQGTVPTLKDKAEAERLARDTKGVVSVMNDLKVASSTDSSGPAASPPTR